VSTLKQNTERQLYGIELDKVFEDKISGRTMERIEFQRCMDYVREGDALYVHSVDRFARNNRELLNYIHILLEKGVEVHFLKHNLSLKPGKKDLTTQLCLTVFSMMAEFTADLNREAALEGIALAQKAGVYKGRKPKFTDEEKQEIREALDKGVSVCHLTKKYNVHRSTIYRAKEGQ